ncbi:MAG: hypothetical protein QM750_20830 [Rubrivivax sp.]
MLNSDLSESAGLFAAQGLEYLPMGQELKDNLKALSDKPAI